MWACVWFSEKKSSLVLQDLRIGRLWWSKRKPTEDRLSSRKVLTDTIWCSRTLRQATRIGCLNYLWIKAGSSNLFPRSRCGLVGGLGEFLSCRFLNVWSGELQGSVMFFGLVLGYALLFCVRTLPLLLNIYFEGKKN